MPLGELGAASRAQVLQGAVVLVLLVLRLMVDRLLRLLVMVVSRVEHRAGRRVTTPVSVSTNVLAHYFALLVVDLLTLLVAEQQDRATKEEDCRAPAYSVGPAKLPHRSVT